MTNDTMYYAEYYKGLVCVLSSKAIELSNKDMVVRWLLVSVALFLFRECQGEFIVHGVST